MVPANGFSMRDEARNTASHQSSWPSGDASFRRRPVVFVSAGFVEPLQDINPPDEPSGSKTVDQSPEATVEAVVDTAEVESSADPFTETTDAMEVEPTVEAVEEAAGLVEAVETIEETVETVEQTVIVELPAQEEVVGNADQLTAAQESEPKELFFFDLAEDESSGYPSIPPPKIPSPRSSFAGSDSSEEVILFRGRTANTQEPVRRNEVSRPSVATPRPEKPSESKLKIAVAIPDKPVPRNLISPPGPRGKRSRSRRNRSKAPKVVEDDEEDAILADYIANMVANSDDDFIGSQLQSLPRRRDLGGDHDAVNFGSEDEKSPRGDDFLGNEAAESVGSGSTDAEGDDSVNGDEEDMDADLGDEALARLFAKQEELGMDGDDLLLFASSFAQTGSRKAQGKRPAKAIGGPASAAQVADAFDNLDLADWGHLTGQTRKRRNKQPPDFNVSDSEIEAALKSAWGRDRERKKGRKLEREALRAEGLLGKDANPDDMRVKYPSGMKLDDMKAELTAFLLGSAERLEFPPIDNHGRKVLHEIAHKFNVKSQSAGKGDQRRPVLYRTNRTIRFGSHEMAARNVSQTAQSVHRKYFPRADLKGPKTEPTRTVGETAGPGRRESNSGREKSWAGLFRSLARKIRDATCWRRWAGAREWVWVPLTTRAFWSRWPKL